MKRPSLTKAEEAIVLLKRRGIMRLTEFIEAGISETTIQRMAKKSQVNRLARGLYQLPGAETDPHHSIAEVAKRIPKGVICLTSALAFHGLTDAIPSRIWVAIGLKVWVPQITDMPVQIVQFGPKVLTAGIETHKIEGVEVRIYSAAKTIVDMFRYRQSAGRRYRQNPGLNLAIEGLREGLRTRKASASAIAQFAEDAGIWKIIEPYLDAMTANV